MKYFRVTIMQGSKGQLNGGAIVSDFILPARSLNHCHAILERAYEESWMNWEVVEINDGY